MQVLIIEDEASMHSIMNSFLQRYGEQRGEPVNIKGLLDPVQGLFEASANGEQYDAILLDVRLPKLTGDEIFRSIRHVNPDITNRVLFVTGYPEDLIGHFADDIPLRVLEKPFRYEAFAASLTDLLPASA